MDEEKKKIIDTQEIVLEKKIIATQETKKVIKKHMTLKCKPRFGGKFDGLPGTYVFADCVEKS